MIVGDVITSAFIQAGKVPLGGGVPTSWLARGLTELNAMLQSWAVEGLLLHTLTTNNVTLVSGTAAYTVGTGGAFNVRRPVECVGATLTVSAGQFRSLRVLNSQFRYKEYATLPTGIPDEVYYDPAFSLGTFTFYPTPDANYAVALDSLVSLAPFATTGDTITLPPEYEQALSANLGMIFLSLPRTINDGGRVEPLLIQRAKDTKAALLTNNSKRLIREVEFDSALLRPS